MQVLERGPLGPGVPAGIPGVRGPQRTDQTRWVSVCERVCLCVCVSLGVEVNSGGMIMNYRGLISGKESRASLDLCIFTFPCPILTDINKKPW